MLTSDSLTEDEDVPMGKKKKKSELIKCIIQGF